MTMQYVIVAIVLLCAVGYLVYRLRKVLHGKADPCEGCAGCQLKNVRKGHDGSCPDRVEAQKIKKSSHFTQKTR